MSIGYGYGLWRGNFSSNYKYQWSLLGVAPGLTSTPTGITFSCASTRTAQTSPSTMITGIGANQAVVSYNPYLGVSGLQSEAAASNYLLYTTVPSNTNWATNTGAGAVLTPGQADPAGGTVAARLQGPALAYGGYLLDAGPVQIAAPICASIWVNSSTHASYSFGNTIPTVDNMPSGTGGVWVRRSITKSTDSSASIILSESRIANNPSGSGATDAILSYAQLENGLIPTSVIPNAGATTVTRAASTITAPISNRLKFSCRFDLYVNNRTDYGTDSKIVFQDTSGTNKLLLYISTGTGVLASTICTIYVNGVQVYVGTNPYPFVAGQKWSWRLTYNGTTYSCPVYKNDVLQWTESYTGAAPSVLTGMCFGSDITGINHWNSQVAFIGAT